MAASDQDDGATRQRSRAAPAPGMRPAYALLVTAGRDQGKRFFFDESLPSRVLAGKSPVCHFRLDDPEVSRRHAAFEIADDGLRIVDLGSTNGTRVGGIRVRDAWVSGGQTIALGATQLKVLEVPVAPDGARAAAPAGDRFGRMLGASTVMKRLYPTIERAAASGAAVLIEGETGTGKELLAECLHEASARASGPFVVADATSLGPSAIEQAAGGTLVVDEIGELPAELQAMLARAIERSDVRLLALTRHDLDRRVQDGTFRDDLFFRVSVLHIELPPLRARVGDVPLLAAHFWRAQGGEGDLPDDLVRRLDHAGDWPGNVRELLNLVARRLALGELRGRPPKSEGPVDSIDKVLDLDLALPESRERVVAEFERRYVERVLAKHGGNVARAAAASGVARRYFQIVKARQKPG